MLTNSQLKNFQCYEILQHGVVRALVNAVMDIRILQSEENFLITCEPVGLSRVPLLQVVSLADLLT